MVFPEPAEAPVILPAGFIATVQLKVVLGVVLVRFILVVNPEQIVWADGVGIASGVGLTVTTTAIGAP